MSRFLQWVGGVIVVIVIIAAVAFIGLVIYARQFHFGHG